MTSARLDDKLFSTLRAKAALVGVSLVRSEDERGQPQYIVTKWALTKSFGNLGEVESLLDRMEGKAA